MWIISDALMSMYSARSSSSDSANAPSLPGPAAASSEGRSSGGKPLSQSNGNRTRRLYLPSDKMTAYSDLSRSGMTFEPLTEQTGEDVLMWFREVFLAKTSAQPAEVLVSPVLARDFGRTWHELSMTFDPDTFWWKTPRSWFSADLMSSLPTLPRWGSMRDGVLWQRRTLVRRTSETEFGYSLPTPVKYDGYGTWESNNYHGLGWLAKNAWPTPVVQGLRGGSGAPADLEQRIRGTWPTPIKSDATISKTDYVLSSVAAGKAFNQLAREVEVRERVKAGRGWPTPLANDAQKRGNINTDDPRSGLKGAVGRERKRVEQFPTPIRNDASSGSDAAGREGGASLKQVIARRRVTVGVPTVTNIPRSSAFRRGVPTPAEIVQATGYGELNPDWVEWLMGWVPGWTSLEPLDLEVFRQWMHDISAVGPELTHNTWWQTDPSEAGTVSRVIAKEAPFRVERISAIGNGQVSAVAAAAFIHLLTLEQP